MSFNFWKYSLGLSPLFLEFSFLNLALLFLVHDSAIINAFIIIFQ